MSQYPSPYSAPPQYPVGYGVPQAPPNLLGPARRSAILMWVVGGLMILSGMCCGIIGGIPLDRLPPESRSELQPLETQLAQSGVSFAAVMWTGAAMVGAVGILLVVLAFFVRRGGMGSVIFALILAALLALVTGFFVLGGAVQGASSGRAQVFLGLCIYLIPFILFIVLLVWLIQAARRAPHIALAAQQHQAIYAQYQQMQQEYGRPAPPPPGYGAGYGYPTQGAMPGAVPSAPAMPVPPPPPPPPSDEPPRQS